MRTDKEKNKGSIILVTILPLISVLSIVLTGFINKLEILDILKIGLMTLILTSIIVFYIRTQENLLSKKFAKSIVFFSYTISILLVMLIKNPQIYSFWMIGSLIIAMLIDKKLGLSVYFNLAIILCITYSVEPENLIHFLVMGILFVLLSDALKSKSTVIYASIIILSTNITLSFILNNFIYDTKRNTNYVASFFSIFAVLVTAFLLSVIYNKFIGNKNITEYLIENNNSGNNESITDKSNLKAASIDEAKEINENTVVNIVDNTLAKDNENTLVKDNENTNQELFENNTNEEEVSSYSNTRTSYDVLLSESNELLTRLKEHSEKIYNHCRRIGDLSARAARIIGANEDLARIGGYYHEIGKIQGNNYIEEGLKLADEYAFPEKLKDILRQHNIKYDKPTFVESAIVMISDNVVTTIEYIENTGDQKFSSDKIIDNIFRMRLEKGTFDESGLSVKDFKILKEFYQNEFKSYGT